MLKILGLITISLSGCSTYKQLESYHNERIKLSKDNETRLYYEFKKAKAQSNDFVNLDSGVTASYKIHAIIGPFFSNHHIFIERKKYSLNLSKPTPIILYNGYIYYPEKHNYSYEKTDTIIVYKVNISKIK